MTLAGSGERSHPVSIEGVIRQPDRVTFAQGGELASTAVRRDPVLAASAERPKRLFGGSAVELGGWMSQPA
jgi:hypothetical protein